MNTKVLSLLKKIIYNKRKLHRTTLCSVVFFVFMLLYTSVVKGQINVSGGKTAAVLAQKLAGPGVTILNPVLKCPIQANGLFTVVSSNLGLDSGIVLSTGRATSILGVPGVNGPSSELASFDNGVAGDPDLDILAGRPTLDACKLEFDVVPVGDTVSIDYVFSSEEYMSAVCSNWNDAFAFFISGPGISGKDNMALVPGTTIPVTINSINNGIPGSSGSLANCTSMGPGSPFTAYYKDNSAGTTLTHKGLTTVLTAMHAVSACDTYHFKIVIADGGNAKYDSGVFLEAGSLKTGIYKVNALAVPVYDSLAPVCIKGCLPGHFRITNSKPSSQPQVIRYSTTGSAVSGVDYVPLADSVTMPAYGTYVDIPVYGLPTPLNGPKTIQMVMFAPTYCRNSSNIEDSAVITIYDTIHLSVSPADTVICGGDSVQMRVNGDNIYTYSWTPATAISDKNAKQPIVFPNVNTSYTVTAYMPGTTCPFKAAKANFIIKQTPSVNLLGDTMVCYNTTFQLSPVVFPSNAYYSYQWVGPAAFSSTVQNPQLSAVGAVNTGDYTITVTNDTNGCKASDFIALTVNVPDTPYIVSPQFYCLDNPAAPLIAEGRNLRWYMPDNSVSAHSPVPPVSAETEYIYHVSEVVDNCESPAVAILVKVEKCCDGNIFIPSAFTPNSDGLNDRFRPREDFSYNLKNMWIFNRWGQIIYSGNQGSWDGNFGNTPADPGTYFYRMIFGCILGGSVEKTGNITLIR